MRYFSIRLKYEALKRTQFLEDFLNHIYRNRYNKEREIFEDVIKLLKKENLKGKDIIKRLSDRYTDSHVAIVLQKMRLAGMIARKDKYSEYYLSKKFSESLRTLAEYWEKSVALK